MLILLPPSEGKFAPRRGRRSTSQAELSRAAPGTGAGARRARRGLPAATRARPATTARPHARAGRRGRPQRRLATAPTAAVSRIYTGVLYDALGFDTLSASARRRASSRLLVTSSLFGLLRFGDRIPAYRLSGDVSLPGVGTVASAWRQPTDDVLAPLADKQLIVDLRSGTYAAFWRPARHDRRKVVTVRVLHDDNGKRSIVSHFNKATKGRIVRAILEDGRDPKTPAGVRPAAHRPRLDRRDAEEPERARRHRRRRS